MRDFTKVYLRGVLVENVNLTRATLKEATEFREKLDKDIYQKNIKVIIDLSQCEFMDSTFLGVLVLIRKKIDKLEGYLKIVEPINFSQSILHHTQTLNLFDTYSSLEDAVNAFRAADETDGRFEKINTL
jgi:anti-anti-sigma factor